MNSIWHRVSINIPELTHGQELMVFLSEILPSEALGGTVVVADVEGGGDPERGITQLNCTSMSVQELLKRLCFTLQIDWANLYFLTAPDPELERRICEGLSISDAISTSTVSVRVIDDSWLDVFTPDRNIAADLLKRHPLSRLESSMLSEMVYPD